MPRSQRAPPLRLVFLAQARGWLVHIVSVAPATMLSVEQRALRDGSIVQSLLQVYSLQESPQSLSQSIASTLSIKRGKRCNPRYAISLTLDVHACAVLRAYGPCRPLPVLYQHLSSCRRSRQPPHCQLTALTPLDPVRPLPTPISLPRGSLGAQALQAEISASAPGGSGGGGFDPKLYPHSTLRAATSAS
jgi:hypothetical protein